MTINPRYFTSFEPFADAMAQDAIKSLPKVTPYDDYREAILKQSAIADAEEAARDKALDVWNDFIEYCEELYERGVGPSWE